MKPLSRRSVTTGLAAAVAVIPLVGLCKGARESAELRDLIKAHRAAYRALGNAIDREQKSDEASRKGEPVVKSSLACGFSLYLGREECRSLVAREYAEYRERLKLLSRASPKAAEAVAAALDAKKSEDIALLDRTFDEHETRFGREAARRELSEADNAETEAALAVCSYRCRTSEEARLKAEYLLTTSLVKDSWDDEAKALLESFLVEAAAS